MNDLTPEWEVPENPVGHVGPPPPNAKTGCVALFVSCLALIFTSMILWAFLYGFVMNYYEIRRPGGFHFGSVDIGYIEAAGKGILLGPFIGIAIMIICARNLKAARFFWVLVLLGVPLWWAYKDFSAYRAEHALSLEPHESQAGSNGGG